MKIGDRVGIRPKTFGKGAMTGEVVWIHPRERYVLVEFEIEPQGPKWLQTRKTVRLRECFLSAKRRK